MANISFVPNTVTLSIDGHDIEVSLAGLVTAEPAPCPELPPPPPPPPPDADAVVTVDDSVVLLASQFSPGCSLTEKNQLWTEPGWPNVKASLAACTGFLSVQLFPFGQADPWKLDNPNGWTPGDNPVPAVPNNLSSFGNALDKLNEISPTATKVVALYGAPWWMKGKLSSDGQSTTPLTFAEQFSDAGRVMTKYLPHWGILAREAAEIALSKGVCWFEVWNEMKGYAFNRFGTPNLWAHDDYAGTPGLHADHGYCELYRRTVNAVLAAATSLGIPHSEIKMCGPYPTIRSRGNPSAESVPTTGYPMLRERPWGTMNKHGVKAVEYFHDWVLAEGIPYGGLSIDFGANNQDDVYTNPEWVRYQKYSDMMDWVGAEFARVGLPSDFPVIGAEAYLISRNATGSFACILEVEAMRRLLLGGMTSPLLWQATWGGDDEALISDPGVASGGTLLTFGDACQMLKDNFPPGTKVVQCSISGGTNLTELVSQNPGGKLLVLNGHSAAQTVWDGNQLHTVPAYGWLVINR